MTISVVLGYENSVRPQKRITEATKHFINKHLESLSRGLSSFKAIFFENFNFRTFSFSG